MRPLTTKRDSQKIPLFIVKNRKQRIVFIYVFTANETFNYGKRLAKDTSLYIVDSLYCRNCKQRIVFTKVDLHEGEPL